ncbi:MAG: hypothetical protein A4S16_05295 [Proteobacteria bacterium SG_bin6]|nr:MAG: hypothetical protein A4S16_05295 [Proteobacteria bacterium SG_bin6]
MSHASRADFRKLAAEFVERQASAPAAGHGMPGGSGAASSAVDVPSLPAVLDRVLGKVGRLDGIETAIDTTRGDVIGLAETAAALKDDTATIQQALGAQGAIASRLTTIAGHLDALGKIAKTLARPQAPAGISLAVVRFIAAILDTSGDIVQRTGWGAIVHKELQRPNLASFAKITDALGEAHKFKTAFERGGHARELAMTDHDWFVTITTLIALAQPAVHHPDQPDDVTLVTNSPAASTIIAKEAAAAKPKGPTRADPKSSA